MVTSEDPDALFERGYEAFRASRFEEAVDLFERARGLSPRRSRTLVYFARAHYGLGRYAEAERVLDALVALRPEDPWSWFRRGHARHAQGHYREALEDIDEAVRLEMGDNVFDQGLDELFLLQASCWEHLGELERAISSFEMYGFAYGHRYVVEREVARLRAMIDSRKGSRKKGQ